jgi:hypothetical protein
LWLQKDLVASIEAERKAAEEQRNTENEAIAALTSPQQTPMIARHTSASSGMETPAAKASGDASNSARTSKRKRGAVDYAALEAQLIAEAAAKSPKIPRVEGAADVSEVVKPDIVITPQA